MTATVLAQRTRAYGDHRIWTGPLDRTVPYIKVGRVRYAVHRLVLADTLGRDPIGEVKPTCDQPLCVAAEHLMDEVGRRNTAALEQILASLDRYLPALLAMEQASTMRSAA